MKSSKKTTAGAKKTGSAKRATGGAKKSSGAKRATGGAKKSSGTKRATGGAEKPSGTKRTTGGARKSSGSKRATGELAPETPPPEDAAPGACLSPLEVRRLAANAPFLGERADHLAACATCAAALQAEMGRLRAARNTRFSQMLRRGARAWWQRQGPWWIPVALVAAAVALALAMPVPGPQPAPPAAPKRKLQAYATVMRQGTCTAYDEPLAKAGPLQAADRVRLRIDSGERRQVRVESHDAQGWRPLIDTTLTSEGWLPNALEISAPHTELRITACADAQQPASCDSETFSL